MRQMVAKAEQKNGAQQDTKAARAAHAPTRTLLGWQQNLGNHSILRRCGDAIQAKLTLGTPGDVYEQEVDRVAGWVTRGVQASGVGHVAVPPAVQEALQSPGHPLDPGTRAFMELRFGYDFGQVRLHTDEGAAHSAQGINARAYTVNNDIVFGAGEYAPELEAGRSVIAHELAHVVQQRIGGDRGDAPGSLVMEQEAERVAWGARLGARTVTVSGAALVGLACLPRSLSSTLAPSMMSPFEIEQEILEIRQWLEAHPQTSADRQLLLGALRTLERHLPGVTAGLPIRREEFAARFNSEFRSVLHILAEPGAPSGQVSPEKLWWLFTTAQRDKLADFMVTRRIPERLFNGAANIGRANAQQRILISAHIITHGTYRPGSFEQRIHARYCGHWVQIVHQYAGVTPASGSWPEGLAGRGIMGSFDPMGVPVFGAGQAQPIFGGVRASAEELPIPEATGHARTAEREEEQLADDPSARRRVHRRTQFAIERFGELRSGDWLYLYNANESVTGQHSVIFSRWVGGGEVRYRGNMPYRQAIVFNQPHPESGGREQTLLLGDQFSPGQRANAAQGIPYLPQIDAITHVVRVLPTARPASAPAELLPPPSATRARQLAAQNDRHIRTQERRLRRTVDRNRLKQWLKNENTRFIAGLGELVSASERMLLTEANRSDQTEALVRLYQRLRALSTNAALAEQSRRRTFDERLSARRAEAQARLDEQRARAGAALGVIDARLRVMQARIGELERSPTAREIRQLQADLDALARQIQRLSRGEERTSLQRRRRESQASIRDLRRQQQAQRTELQRLRQQVATLQRQQATIMGQVSAAEGRLPFGLLPGRPRGEDPGAITGRLQDLRPPPPWSSLVVQQSTPAARQREE